MGLASSLTTALTGMSAAETQVDVVGNNLANSQTVGFKESRSVFATQFLQNYSIGSGPTATSGGTNPRQTGLGTRVADTAGVIESATLGDANVPRPDVSAVALGVAATPDSTPPTPTVGSAEGAGGTHAEGAVYKYRFAFADASGTEGPASNEITVTVPAGDTFANNSIILNNLPAGGAAYPNFNIYRTHGVGAQDLY